jgi:Nucleotidyltransferase substrate binding protein like
MLKRYLQMSEANPNLIGELTIWKGFRRDRGTTRHTYDERKAIEFFATIPIFLAEAKFLATQLARRQEGGV